MSESKSPQIMIDWASRRIYCETCNEWVNGENLLINGNHIMPDINGTKSNHTVWER
jgi:hypothetical protein